MKNQKQIYSMIYFDEINEEKFIPFFKEISEIIHQVDHIDLYFSTIGGSVSLAEAFADFIHINKDKITLKIFDIIASSGFTLFIMAECERKLLNGAYAMTHKCILEADTRSLLKEKTKKVFLKHWNDDANNKEYKNILPYITKEEAKAWRDGQDVYLSKERLQEIIDSQKQSNK